jgi:hypothetical protein
LPLELTCVVSVDRPQAQLDVAMQYVLVIRLRFVSGIWPEMAAGG